MSQSDKSKASTISKIVLDPTVLKTIGGIVLAVGGAVGLSLYSKYNPDCWINRGGADITDGVIAIDIAVVPPKDILELCQEINQEIAQNTDSFLFDSTHYPHITLTHMYVKLCELHLLVDKLTTEILKLFTSSTMSSEYVELTHFSIGPTWSPNVVLPYIACANTGIISTLHNIVKSVTSPFRQRPIMRTWINRTPKIETLQYIQECFFTKDAPITMSTAVYAEEFDIKSSGYNYNPHITIASGDPEIIQPILDRYKSKLTKMNSLFTVDNITLFQLGEYGACRNIIYDYPLEKQNFNV